MEDLSADAPVDIDAILVFTEGDPEDEKELFEMFIEQMEFSLLDLEKSMKEGNGDAWRKTAHRMKGAAVNLGANIFCMSCKEADENIDMTLEDKKKIFLRMKEQMKDVSQFLEERMKKNPILK